jgi:hypothetical protein
MIAAVIVILKLMGQGRITVYRMMKSEMGLLNPEDLLPGPSIAIQTRDSLNRTI